MLSRWRVGDPDGRALRFQEGAKPSGEDRFLGLMEKAELAEIVVEAVDRFNAEFKAPFVNSVWEPRYPSDPQHDDPLKVVDAHGGAYLCAVMDGGSSTVRRSALQLNLYYRRKESGR